MPIFLILYCQDATGNPPQTTLRYSTQIRDALPPCFLPESAFTGEWRGLPLGILKFIAHASAFLWAVAGAPLNRPKAGWG